MPNSAKNNMALRSRNGLLDAVRGAAILSMVLYHTTWDLVFLFGHDWAWAQGMGAYVWQQSICWTFILLSGLCWPLGRHPLRRGVLVFACGWLITLVTALVTPESLVLFGILTFSGSAMLLMLPLHPVLRRVPPAVGGAISFLLFCLFRNVNKGSLGFEGLELAKLPAALYRDLFTTYLGFMKPRFFSTDYFSLLPWLFLFIAGYFLGINSKKWLSHIPQPPYTGPLQFLGRHSLVIYMLHQPVVYAILLLAHRFSA